MVYGTENSGQKYPRRHEIVSENQDSWKMLKKSGAVATGNKKEKKQSPRKFHLLDGFLKICHFENSEVWLLEETRGYFRQNGLSLNRPFLNT